MEEETIYKELQEALNNTHQLLHVETMKRAVSDIKFQEQIAGIDRKFTHTLAELKLQLLELAPSRFGNESVLGGFPQTPGGKLVASQNHVHTPLPRMDFPRFDGSHPRAWILQCNKYFKLMPTVPDAQRIILATRHFEGKALFWFQTLNMGELIITWKQFLEVVFIRFEVQTISNIIMEFNELKQNGSYDDYVERFEELMACMLLYDESKYSVEYYIASFLRGLNEEVRAFINMFQPRTLYQAIELGKKQLVTLDAISMKLQPHDATEQMFVAQKGMEIGIPEVEINMVQAVDEVGDFVQAMFSEEGFIAVRIGSTTENHQLDYATISFPIVLKGRGVKQKALTTAVGGTEPPGSSLIHEEIHTMEQIFVLNIEEMWDSLEVFGRNILRSWKLSSIISHNLMENHINSIKSYMDSSRTEDSKLMTRRQHFMQALDADGNFKDALPSVLDSHFIIRKNEKISKIFVTWLISDFELSMWEDEKYSHCKFLTFDPWGQGSSSGGGIVMAYVKEKGKVIEVEEGKEEEWWMMELGKNAGGQFDLGSLIWEESTADELKENCQKFSSLDPRGRGSYQPGGIVMYCEGGKESVKANNRNVQLKKKEEIGKDEEEKLDSGADLGKKGRWTWATQITMIWASRLLMGCFNWSWAVKVNLFLQDWSRTLLFVFLSVFNIFFFK